MKTISGLVVAASALVAVACGGGGGGGAADPATGQTAAGATVDGAEVYSSECQMCHGADGMKKGSPPVMGAGALGKFATAKDLHAYVSKEMPLPKPKAGSLSDAQYWAVVGYLVEKNGGSVPADGLNAGNAGSVKVK